MITLNPLFDKTGIELSKPVRMAIGTHIARYYRKTQQQLIPKVPEEDYEVNAYPESFREEIGRIMFEDLKIFRELGEKRFLEYFTEIQGKKNKSSNNRQQRRPQQRRDSSYGRNSYNNRNSYNSRGASNYRNNSNSSSKENSSESAPAKPRRKRRKRYDAI